MTWLPYVAGRDFPRRILAVDDDPIQRELCGMRLALPGVTCDLAADGVEAMEKIAGGYDVVILDLEMPRLDGLGVLKGLKSLELKSPPQVIVLTSRSEAPTIAAAFELGAVAYALKPVNWEGLLDKISKAYLSADR